MAQSGTTHPPLRRIDYGEPPPDAEFLEVYPRQYRIAREFTRTGNRTKVLAADLGISYWHVSRDLARIRQQTGYSTRVELWHALQEKHLLLVEVQDHRRHDHRKTNWLTRVSPAVPAERTAGV